MRAFFYLLIIISLGACAPKESSGIDSPILDYSYDLIDRGEIIAPFLFFIQIYQNDKIDIYRHDQSTSIFTWVGYNFPSSVYKYKNTYICIFRLDYPEISEKELLEKFPEIYSLNDHDLYGSFKSNLDEVVFPKDSLPFLLIPEGEGDNRDFYEYPEVWPYLPGYKKNDRLNIMLSWVFLHNDFKRLKKEDLKSEHLTDISIGINFANLTDSVLYVPLHEDVGGFFALLNGNDTILLTSDRYSSYVTDDLLELRNDIPRTVSFNFADSSYYKKITQLDDLTLLYTLLRDSLFYFPSSSVSTLPENSFFTSSPIKPMSVGYKDFYLNNIYYEEGRFIGIDEDKFVIWKEEE